MHFPSCRHPRILITVTTCKWRRQSQLYRCLGSRLTSLPTRFQTQIIQSSFDTCECSCLLRRGLSLLLMEQRWHCHLVLSTQLYEFFACLQMLQEPAAVQQGFLCDCITA